MGPFVSAASRTGDDLGLTGSYPTSWPSSLSAVTACSSWDAALASRLWPSMINPPVEDDSGGGSVFANVTKAPGPRTVRTGVSQLVQSAGCRIDEQLYRSAPRFQTERAALGIIDIALA